jgi:hypothetical protein
LAIRASSSNLIGDKRFKPTSNSASGQIRILSGSTQPSSSRSPLFLPGKHLRLDCKANGRRV